MKECLSTKSVPISIDWLASACGTPTFWYTPDPRSAGGTNSALVPAACGRSGVEEGGEAIVGDTVARRRWVKATVYKCLLCIPNELEALSKRKR